MSLMFHKQDVDKTDNLLVALLRRVFIKKRITLDKFSMFWASHGLLHSLTTSIVNTRRDNDRKALNNSKSITYFLFNRILMLIGYEVEEIRLVVRDPITHSLVVYNSEAIPTKSHIHPKEARDV